MSKQSTEGGAFHVNPLSFMELGARQASDISFGTTDALSTDVRRIQNSNNLRERQT